MSIDFILITIIFIIVITIAYFLKSIRYSFPLVVIYFFYVITAIFNNNPNIERIPDSENNFDTLIKGKKEKVNEINNDSVLNRADSESKSKYNAENKTVKYSNKNKNIIVNAKPIVSNNPKPIMIDTSIINNVSSFEKTTNDTVSSNNRSNDDEAVKTKKLKLNEIMICRDIYKRNPVKPGINFINTVDTLFCYTKISNSGLKQQVRHVWFYNNKEITTVKYNIKPSFNYRSWSRKKIMKNQIGEWRVDVVDSNNELLGSINFNVNSINSAY